MPSNLPVEERRAIDVRAHEIADAIVGVKQIAVDLRRARSVRSETRTAPADRRRARRVKRAVADLRDRSRCSRDRAAAACRSSAGPTRSRTTSATPRARATAARRRGRPDAAPDRCESGRSGTCPVVTTSARHAYASPSSIARPTTRPCSTRMRPAVPISHSMFGSRSSAARHPRAVDASCPPARAATRPPARGCD